MVGDLEDLNLNLKLKWLPSSRPTGKSAPSSRLTRNRLQISTLTLPPENQHHAVGYRAIGLPKNRHRAVGCRAIDSKFQPLRGHRKIGTTQSAIEQSAYWKIGCRELDSKILTLARLITMSLS